MGQLQFRFMKAKDIKYIVLHCSDTKAGKNFKLADIDRWHKARGWAGCGYHYVIRLDGTIEVGRPHNVQGAHCLPLNPQSLGICYIGGQDADGNHADTRTPQQRYALCVLLGQLHYKYPDARIVGHREYAAKACPCFDAAEYRKMFGQS